MTIFENVSPILKNKAKTNLIPSYEAMADGKVTQFTDATWMGEQIDRDS